MLYRHVFDKISTEFRGYFSCFCEFHGISRIYRNFAALRLCEISEALKGLARFRYRYNEHCLDRFVGLFSCCILYISEFSFC